MASCVLGYQVMYRARRSGEARTGNRKPNSWLGWAYWAGILCTLVAALSAFGVARWPGAQTRTVQLSAMALRWAPAFDSVGQSNFPQRRLYPYSVIPGGVQNIQELRNAVANDPLVARLYANFDLSRAHVVRLAQNEEVYVAYRLNGKIYWTKKRLLLRAGETVITDGKHEARTRCGNRISETPMQPVAPVEPPNAAVNAPPGSTLVAENPAVPQLPPLDPPFLDPATPGLAFIPQPPANPPPDIIPPPIFPIVGGGPPSFPYITPPPPPPPISTPEPGTLSLLGLGILALGTAAGISKIREILKT